MPAGHRRRDDVDALVDPLAAHALRAEDLVGARVDDELEGHRLGARVVAGVRCGVGVEHPDLAATGPQQLLAPPGRRDRQAHDPDHGGAERVAHRDGLAGDHVRDEPAVPVGEAREGDEALLAGDRVDLLDGVADGVDARGRWCAAGRRPRCRRARRASRPADRARDVSGRTPIEASTKSAANHAAVAEGGGVRHRARRPGCPAARPPRPRAAVRRPGRPSRGRAAAAPASPSSTRVTARPRCTRFSTISRPTNPAPITRALRGPRFEASHRGIDVLDVAQGRASARRRARADARATPRATARGRRSASVDSSAVTRSRTVTVFAAAVDRGDLVVHAHVEVEAGAERCWGLQEQVLAVLDDTAEVVGQPAVGERDVAAALEHDDLGVLHRGDAAGSRRTCRPRLRRR